MTYKNAFPDFDDELPMIEGWEDISYKNDTCPSIGRPCRIGPEGKDFDLQIYVDYKDIKLREGEGIIPRYSLLDIRNEAEPNPSTILDSDSWDEILEAVKAFDLKNAG